MLFQNASKGLKSVFTAEIFEILGTFLFAIVTGTAAGNAVRIICACASLVLIIAALVYSVKGLRLAAEDDPSFRSAYNLTVGLLIVEMMYIVFGVLARWVQFFERFALSNTLVSVFALLSNIYVALGIRHLFQRMEDKKNAGFAMAVAVLTIIGGVLDIGLIFLNSYLISVANTTALLAVSIGYIVFNIVVFVLYLVLLRKGVKKFA